MTTRSKASPAPGHVPAGLEARLLAELKRSNIAAPERTPDGRLPAQRFVALYRAAIEGLEAQVAQGDGHPPMRKQEVDLMCRCLLSCGTLAEAVRCAAEFCAMLHPRAGALTLDTQSGSATFRMDTLRRRHSTAACLVDLTGLFCYLQLFGWLIGRPLRPSRVFLAHPRRDDAMPFLGLFNAQVTVGAASYGFSFDAALLSQPVVRQPAELEPFLVDFPFRLVGAPADVVSWGQQVRGFLDAALARDHALPMLADVARCFGVSEPTLRRRLAAEDASYQALREQCLREAAERGLRHTDWSIGRLAGHLGFGSEAAFRRAFLRWTGQAPSHFRRLG